MRNGAVSAPFRPEELLGLYRSLFSSSNTSKASAT